MFPDTKFAFVLRAFSEQNDTLDFGMKFCVN